jgi:hypothetical protein
MVPVQTGASDGTMTEVTKGNLEEGTRVVIGAKARSARDTKE